MSRRQRKKKEKRTRKGPFPLTSQKESLEIPRHMLHGTSRLLTRPHSRNIRHPLARLTPSLPLLFALQRWRNSNLRTDCPGCVFRTYEKWVWPGEAPCYTSSSFSFLPRFATPFLPLAFTPRARVFPKPFLSYAIAAEAPKFIAGRVEELKRLRTIRTDTKLNSLICVAFNSYLFGVLVVNCILKYQFDKLSIIVILQAVDLLILSQHFYCFDGKKERIMRCAQ